MKKSSTALAALVAAASLAGAATVSAHAYPAQQLHHEAVHSSRVATVRLHTLLETPGSTGQHAIRPNDWGSAVH